MAGQSSKTSSTQKKLVAVVYVLDPHCRPFFCSLDPRLLIHLLMVAASTRPPRKSTLSLREFSHLVSESLDVSHSANMSLLAHSTLFSELEKDSPGKGRSSPFQRIFSRPSPGPPTPSPVEGYTEDTPSTPRKMAFTWPFIRPSPNKQRSMRDDPNGLVSPLHLAVFDSHISPRIRLTHMPQNHPTL